MKFKVGDKVIVTAGKDKGKKSVIVALLPKAHKVLVKDVNLYYKHVKPFMDKPGEKTHRERPLSVAKIAVLNDQDQADRLAYRLNSAGQKERYFKKTKTVAAVEKSESKAKTTKKGKKATKKTDKKTKPVEVGLKAQEAIAVEKKAARKASTKSAKVSRIRKTQEKG